MESIKMFTTRRGFLLTTAGSAVAITLSACSGTQSGGGSSAEGLQNTSGAMTSFKAGDPFMATQALNVSMLFSDAPTYPNKSDWLLWSEITKRTNVTINTTLVPASDYGQKRSLLIGAGSAPTIIAKTYPGQETAYVSSGAILAVSDYLDLMPNLSEKISKWSLSSNIDSLRQADGKFYLLPGVHQDPWQDYTIAIRTDVLAQLGLKSPTSWAEFRTFLEKIKASHPASYPFSDRFNVTYPGGNVLGIASVGYGTKAGWAYSNFTWDPSHKTFVSTPKMDEYKALVEYFRGLVGDGLMDPESFTQTDDAAIQKFVTGKSFAISTNAQTVANDYTKGLTTNIPTATVDKMQFPSGPAGALLDPVTKLENGLMINASLVKSPNFVATMQFIDWLWYSDDGQEFTKWGVKGTTFTKDASGKRMLDPGITFITMNPGAPKHLQKDFGFSGGNFAYGGTTELLQSTFSPAEIAFQKSIADYRLIDLAPPAPLNEAELEQATLMATALNDAVSQGTVQFILGRRAMSDWSQFMSELDAKGATKYVDLVNGARARYLKEHP